MEKLEFVQFSIFMRAACMYESNNGNSVINFSSVMRVSMNWPLHYTDNRILLYTVCEQLTQKSNYYKREYHFI